MMRPVILSRPENTAVGLGIFSAGGSTTTWSFCGGGAAAAGGGAPGRTCPGGGAPCGGAVTSRLGSVPGGGDKGCDWMVPPPGRACGGRFIGAGNGSEGGSSRCCGGPRLG